jgi:hypothetical protein
VSLAVTKENTHANHHERQFLQYLQVNGKWRVRSPIAHAWSKSFWQGVGLNGSRVSLTASFIEILKKAPLPRRLGSCNLRCPLRLDAGRASVCNTKMSVANVEAIR